MNHAHFIPALACALFAVLLSACNGAVSEPAHAPESAHEHAHDELESTQIPLPMATAAGIRVAAAGAAVIADEHEVQGLLAAADDKLAKVAARYAGPIRSVRVNVGDAVTQGQVLAEVDSNQSLSRYALTSPINGVVMRRSAVVGAVAEGATPLFEIADLSTLWVDLHIFGADAQHITAGVPVTVTRLADGVRARTTLERILPGMATASQSTVARARIANADGQWRPGAAVKARVTVARTPVALAVPLSAVQTMDDQTVVFVRSGDADDTFTAQPVTLGLRDAEQVQVLSGLTAGASVVVEQSYWIKADIEKSEAEHEH